MKDNKVERDRQKVVMLRRQFLQSDTGILPSPWRSGDCGGRERTDGITLRANLKKRHETLKARGNKSGIRDKVVKTSR